MSHHEGWHLVAVTVSRSPPHERRRSLAGAVALSDPTARVAVGGVIPDHGGLVAALVATRMTASPALHSLQRRQPRTDSRFHAVLCCGLGFMVVMPI